MTTHTSSAHGFIQAIRLGAADVRYDFWLDMCGVRGRRRRDLRSELRGNLVEASERVGSRNAVRAVGPIRTLARAATEASQHEVVGSGGGAPGWWSAATAAVGVFAAASILELLAALWWFSGAAAANQPTVSGSLPLFVGSQLELSHPDDGLSFILQPGWTVPVIAILAYIFLAKPWTVLRRGAGQATR